MSATRTNEKYPSYNVPIIPKAGNFFQNPCNNLTNSQKWVASLILSGVIAFVFSKLMYSVTNSVCSLFGMSTATEGGATLFGFLLHWFVAFLAIRLLLW